MHYACCVLLLEELDFEGDEIGVVTGEVDSLEKWKGDALREYLSDLLLCFLFGLRQTFVGVVLLKFVRMALDRAYFGAYLGS